MKPFHRQAKVMHVAKPLSRVAKKRMGNSLQAIP